MNLRLDTLSNLRTLKCSNGSWMEEGGLACMTNFQQLKIVDLTIANLDLVVSNIERLHCLQSLSLEFMGGQPTTIRLSHFEHLHKLHLAGRINKLPKLPQNLVKLSLLYSDLEEDSIDDLEELIVEEGAMMKLKNLDISRCPRLELGKIPERLKLLTSYS
ncbi:unnamed protein product [Prunus armeniaca]|uniref:NB-ARC domain-containing protein n=1 Tax=Prunus armeniaca TaxID=36596 RepID=A0A6J5Y3W1_PRUAR|nr:unnamed protein product [Prunus armeniaca]